MRYLTPHSKWSIHSEFQDNLLMLTLFRGGPVMWLSPDDAEKIDIADNDWIEVYNRHGVVACRAAVSHRIPGAASLLPLAGPSRERPDLRDHRARAAAPTTR